MQQSHGCGAELLSSKERPRPTGADSLWAMRDLNPRPLPCEGSALPAAPIARILSPPIEIADATFDTSSDRCVVAHRRVIGSGERRHVARETRPHETPQHAESDSVWFPSGYSTRVFQVRRNVHSCGCGAVVAHHLAKVRVASSNLVIRSNEMESVDKPVPIRLI